MPNAKFLINNSSQTIQLVQNGKYVLSSLTQELQKRSTSFCPLTVSLLNSSNKVQLKNASTLRRPAQKLQHRCKHHHVNNACCGQQQAINIATINEQQKSYNCLSTTNIIKPQMVFDNYKLKQNASKNHLSIRQFSSTNNSMSAAKIVREASTQAQQIANADEQTLPITSTVERQHKHSPQRSTFKYSELQINECQAHELKPKPDVKTLAFGHCFTDHMFRCDWDFESGWSVPSIAKISNLDLHPASKVLHYAVETFEGAKAFRGDDDTIRFFRLDENIKRLQKSAQRASLPSFDERELIECVHKLVHVDKDWIPQSFGELNALYLRPTMIGVDPSLGVAASRKAILYVLLSPVRAYFSTGFKPVTLFADPDCVRAWPGGAGQYKLGSNYAPTIRLQMEAEKRGFQQVLWLYDNDLKLTEVGTMNIFVVYKRPDSNKLCVVTPPLNDGLILPGITRKSIIELIKNWSDIEFEERYPTLGEIESLANNNQLVEMFGSGTACIVCPISLIQLKDGPSIKIPSKGISLNKDSIVRNDHLSQRILNAITDIQYGRVRHHWAQELMFAH